MAKSRYIHIGGACLFTLHSLTQQVTEKYSLSVFVSFVSYCFNWKVCNTKKIILVLFLFYELVWQKCWCYPLKSVCLMLSRDIRLKLVQPHSLQNSHFISKQVKTQNFETKAGQILMIQEFKNSRRIQN